MKKLLITGGAGFIGSTLVRYLIRHTEQTIINVDKLTYASNLSSLESIADHERYYFEQVDICTSGRISDIFYIFLDEVYGDADSEDLFTEEMPYAPIVRFCKKSC